MQPSHHGVRTPDRKWRKPFSYFLHRLFNIEPYRDFGILDELVGMMLIGALALTTITIIFGKEVTKTWVDTADTDWQKGTRQNLEIVDEGVSASLGLKKEEGGWALRTKPITNNITGIAMLSASSGWAVGEEGKILRTTDGGETWSTTTSGTSEGLWSVAFTAESSGVAVGNNGTILEWNGSSWQPADTPLFTTLLSVALKGQTGFAVGEEGKILKWDGTAWSEDTSPTTKTLFSVALASDRAFAVGEEGVMLSWDGSSWSDITSPTAKNLLSVKLFSSSFGMAVGEGGTILQWNGSAWSKKTSGTTNDLNAVAMTGSAALAGGGQGTMFRWNGSNWINESITTEESIFALAFPSATKAVAVGTSGIVATFDGVTYAHDGTLTSQTFDAGKEVAWDTLQWSAAVPIGTTLQLQFAANNDKATWDYAGPDGKATSYYTTTKQNIFADLGKKQYARYRAFFTTTDSDATPLLHAVTLLAKEEVVEEVVQKKTEETVKKTIDTPKEVEKTPTKESSPEPSPPVITTEPSPSPTPTPPATTTITIPTPASSSSPSSPSEAGGGGGGSVSAPPQQRVITPELLLPTNNTLIQGDNASLRWNATEETESYTLELARDTSFTTPLVRTTVTTTSYTNATPLENGSYFWRVQPILPPTIDRRGDWSSTFTFTLTNKPPLPKVASPVLSKPIAVDSSTITIEGIAFPHATVRIIITSNIVEKTVVADENGAWRLSLPRSLVASGQHLTQAQIFTQEGQVTPAITIGEFFIPFPPPPAKNAAVATARAIQKTAERTAEVTKEVARKTVEQTVVVAEKTQEVIKENETEAKVALTATVPIVTAANPTILPALSNLHVLFYHFFSGVLSLFGIRKKRRPWGIVYDAITKEPVGLAIIRLFDAQSKKLIETQVTDNEGRFGFLVQPSSYTMEIVKQDFAYPSKLITGKTDGDFEDCYHGEALATKEGTINVSVPLDPLNKKEARRKQPLFIAVKSTMHALALPLLIIGWTSSWLVALFAYSATNLAMTFIYLFFAIVHVILLPKKFRPWGTVFSTNSLEPVPLAVISIIDTKFNRVLKSRLTDYSGRFNFLPPAGEYKLTVKKEGFDFPSKSKPTTHKFRNLYFGQNIIVRKEKAIVSTDVPVEKK